MCWKHTCFFGFCLVILLFVLVVERGALFGSIFVVPIDFGCSDRFWFRRKICGRGAKLAAEVQKWSVGAVFAISLAPVFALFRVDGASVGMSWSSLYWVGGRVGSNSNSNFIYWQRSKPMQIVSIWNNSIRIDLYRLALQGSNWIASEGGNRHWWDAMTMRIMCINFGGRQSCAPVEEKIRRAPKERKCVCEHKI